MNLFEVIKMANGKQFFRKSEPDMIYSISTRKINEHGAIMEYQDLALSKQEGCFQVGYEYVSLSGPRILANDWEVYYRKE